MDDGSVTGMSETHNSRYPLAGSCVACFTVNSAGLLTAQTGCISCLSLPTSQQQSEIPCSILHQCLHFCQSLALEWSSSCNFSSILRSIGWSDEQPEHIPFPASMTSQINIKCVSEWKTLKGLHIYCIFSEWLCNMILPQCYLFIWIPCFSVRSGLFWRDFAFAY